MKNHLPQLGNGESNRKIVVVFGGTFDPVHVGHLHGALHVSTSLGGAAVTLMVAPNPQLRKPPAASFQDRWTMLLLACQSNSPLQASRFEDSRDGPTRTIETLKDLAKTNDLPIVWAIGMDAFRNVSSWYRANELPDVVSFFVLDRLSSSPGEMPSGFCRVNEAGQLLDRPGGVFVSSTPMLDVSATEIRQKIREGCDVSELLHPEVCKHIIKNRLYRG